MNVRAPWPWISVLIAALIVLNPLGLDIIRLAFFSNEALSRNIWAPIVLTAAAMMAVAVVLEWQLRRFIIRRRKRAITNSN